MSSTILAISIICTALIVIVVVFGILFFSNYSKALKSLRSLSDSISLPPAKSKITTRKIYSTDNSSDDHLLDNGTLQNDDSKIIASNNDENIVDGNSDGEDTVISKKKLSRMKQFRKSYYQITNTPSIASTSSRKDDRNNTDHSENEIVDNADNEEDDDDDDSSSNSSSLKIKDYLNAFMSTSNGGVPNNFIFNINLQDAIENWDM